MLLKNIDAYCVANYRVAKTLLEQILTADFAVMRVLEQGRFGFEGTSLEFLQRLKFCGILRIDEKNVMLYFYN